MMKPGEASSARTAVGLIPPSEVPASTRKNCRKKNLTRTGKERLMRVSLLRPSIWPPCRHHPVRSVQQRWLPATAETKDAADPQCFHARPRFRDAGPAHENRLSRSLQAHGNKTGSSCPHTQVHSPAFEARVRCRHQG